MEGGTSAVADKVKLAIGQRLWYKNKETALIGYVIVERVYDEFFVYRLNGTERRGSYEWIGTRLYCSMFDIPLSNKIEDKTRRAIRKNKPLPKLKYKNGYNFRVNETERPLLSRAPKMSSVQTHAVSDVSLDSSIKRIPSCDICALRKNGSCGSLSNQLCEDYRPTQYISKEELDSFPEFGLATSIRMRGKK